MITFLRGEYGSGKSTYIINEIEKDCQNGIKCVLIVPEQQSVDSERELARRFPPSYQLSYEVTNFTRLANSIFRKYGGLKYNYVTKSAKSLIMYKAICACRESLKNCNIEKGHEKSFVTIFLQAISELKAYGAELPTFSKAAERIEADEDVSPQLKDKLHNISIIWSAYNKLLSEKYSDPLDDAIMLAKKLQEVDYFQGKRVYIDSFYSFTRSQIDIIKQIEGKASKVTISFDCPCEEASDSMQYAKILKSLERISDLFNYEPEVIQFKRDYKHKSDTLKHVCKNIWNFSAGKIKGGNGVTIAKCSDEFEECEVVATKIRELVSSGCKYSDIAIIARNPSSYRGILDFTLKKFDIPYFFSVPADLLGKPVVKMIFSALNAITGYKREDIMSYVKCGYLDISPDVEAELEAYIHQWGIYGKRCWTGENRDDYWNANPDGYVEEPTEEQNERLARIIGARDLISKNLSIIEDAFTKKKSVKECSLAIFNFLTAHNILEKLENEKKSSARDEALQIVQVWKSLLSSLDTLVDVCGDSYVDSVTFSTLLQYAFVDAEIGTIPTSEDSVLVADASMVRAKSIKTVFLLGANEGVFPATISESSYFNDTEKTTLESNDIYTSEGSDIRASDELLFFNQALALASKRAFVLCIANSINGDKRVPSTAFNRILALLDNPKEIIPSKQTLLNKIYTKGIAKELLGQASPELSVAICEELKPKNSNSSPSELELSSSIYEQITNNTGKDKEVSSFVNDRLFLSEDMARTVFKKTIKLTQSSIEKFQSCHFSYYCSKFLRLRSSKKFAFSSIEVGDLFHYVFDHIVTEIKERKDKIKALNDKEIDAWTLKLANDYISLICSGVKNTSKLTHFLERMRANLLIVARRVVDEFKHSSFVPAFSELNFDGEGENEPLPLSLYLSDGTRVILHGKADRIDIYRDGKSTYVRVVDYKTGTKTFDMNEFKQGTQLQLFIYLFALCEMKDCKFKRDLASGTDKILPAGAGYLQLKVGKVIASDDQGLASPDIDKVESDKILELARPSGRFLADSAIKNAQDDTSDKRFLSSEEKEFISLDDFSSLYGELQEIVKSIATTMVNGDASAIPKSDGMKSSCDFCEMRAFCRRRI